jgi:hypothetical protein
MVAYSSGLEATQLGREVWVEGKEASLAPEAGVEAWTMASGGDLYFESDEQGAAPFLELTRYGCGQRAQDLPPPVLLEP